MRALLFILLFACISCGALKDGLEEGGSDMASTMFDPCCLGVLALTQSQLINSPDTSVSMQLIDSIIPGCRESIDSVKLEHLDAGNARLMVKRSYKDSLHYKKQIIVAYLIRHSKDSILGTTFSAMYLLKSERPVYYHDDTIGNQMKLVLWRKMTQL